MSKAEFMTISSLPEAEEPDTSGDDHELHCFNQIFQLHGQILRVPSMDLARLVRNRNPTKLKSEQRGPVSSHGEGSRNLIEVLPHDSDG
ncbi:MAG: hypothetical protein Q9212_005507 [Teloschistes hypoglaucus]